MKKYLIIASALFLSACSLSNSPSNPFSSSTEVSSLYTSQFSDVPIPTQMKSNIDATLTTISSSGEKIGMETFSGHLDDQTLGASMAHNLANQGWSMLGIIQSNRTLQLYQKESRYLVITIESGALNSAMELWMVNKYYQGSGDTNPAKEAFSAPKKQQKSQQRTPPKKTNSAPVPPQNSDNFGSESLSQ